MAVSDVIAVYAALVGTAAVAWPVSQARKARRPDVEVALFFTTLRNEVSAQEFRCLFLEARNRGDHPIRVTTAGVSNEKINYTFMPGRIDVYKKGDVSGVVSAPLGQCVAAGRGACLAVPDRQGRPSRR